VSASLVFEFPTAAAAADFADAFVDGTTRLEHRVVDVEAADTTEAREMARALGGREA